ncbi:MAG: hypothetical protein WED33_01115, partial [Bacteroidia bacterium]
SYVDGFMAKYGSTAFTFPLGRNGHYKPLTMSAPGIITTFKAMYANLDPSEEHSFSSKDGSINEISTNEYWKFERTFGTANVEVSLYRDNMGCSYDTLDNLKIAAYNGSTWKDLGNGGTTGNDTLGTITTNGVTSVYGMYTLATTDTFDCVPCRADAGEDKILSGFPEAIIGTDVINSSEYNFNWQPNYPIQLRNTPKVYISPSESIVYKLSVTNTKGCSANDDVEATVIPRPKPIFNHQCIIPN